VTDMDETTEEAREALQRSLDWQDNSSDDHDD
jgi:queuine/archaeosine tRNA-ribosyltransferase